MRMDSTVTTAKKMMPVFYLFGIPFAWKPYHMDIPSWIIIILSKKIVQKEKKNKCMTIF